MEKLKLYTPLTCTRDQAVQTALKLIKDLTQQNIDTIENNSDQQFTITLTNQQIITCTIKTISTTKQWEITATKLK